MCKKQRMESGQLLRTCTFDLSFTTHPWKLASSHFLNHVHELLRCFIALNIVHLCCACRLLITGANLHSASTNRLLCANACHHQCLPIHNDETPCLYLHVPHISTPFL